MMATNVMKWNRKGKTATLADAVLPNMPGMAGRLLAVVAVEQAADEGVTRADGSVELTTEGKRAEVGRVVATALAALRPHEEEAARMAAEAASLRARAAETPAQDGSELRQLFVAREIRDRLEGVDQVMVLPRYFQAIDSGDWQFVRAVESAPRSFALLTDEALRRGADAKVARSPLAPQVREAEAQADALRSIVNSAKAALVHYARAHGLDNVA